MFGATSVLKASVQRRLGVDRIVFVGNVRYGEQDVINIQYVTADDAPVDIEPYTFTAETEGVTWATLNGNGLPTSFAENPPGKVARRATDAFRTNKIDATRGLLQVAYPWNFADVNPDPGQIAGLPGAVIRLHRHGPNNEAKLNMMLLVIRYGSQINPGQLTFPVSGGLINFKINIDTGLIEPSDAPAQRIIIRTGTGAALDTMQGFVANEAGAQVGSTTPFKSANDEHRMRVVTTDAAPRAGFILPDGKRLVRVESTNGSDRSAEFIQPDAVNAPRRWLQDADDRRRVGIITRWIKTEDI